VTHQDRHGLLPPITRRARVSPAKRELARRLRRAATPSERAAWQVLRNRGCHGLKFRRQQPLRGYIVDFYCAELRLALEIDGPVHWQSEKRFAYDLERVEALENHGVRVLRIRPQDVPDLGEILAAFMRAHPLSRQGEGDGG
jgi:very-short-patch-repair endonuclease